MNEHDTLELRRMVEQDPTSRGVPDLAVIMAQGDRIRTRRRARASGLVLGVVAATLAPALALGLLRGAAPDEVVLDTTVATSPAPWPELDCGLVSCVTPDSSPQTEPVLAELELATTPSGARDVLYVLEGDGYGERAGQKVDVVAAGFREDGQLRRTAWALHVDLAAAGEPRFWVEAGQLGGRPADSDHYVVLGYVEGTPERITWTTPDGASGEAAAILRRDDYSAFALTVPFPADHVPPPRVVENADGSFTVETPDGPVTVREGETVGGRSLQDLVGQVPLFQPDLTVSTSDGWSCTLAACGSSG